MARIPFPLTPGCAALLLAGLLAACGSDGSGTTHGAQASGPQGTVTVPGQGGGEVETGGPGSTPGADTGSGSGSDSDSGAGSGTAPGSGNDGNGEHGDPADAPETMMACPDVAPAGSVAQCSGGEILRSDNGVGVTRSGVQVWAKSTRDQDVVAYGLAPAGFGEGMRAEVRIARNLTTGAAINPALLLDHMDISWDGRNERPPVIDTFHAGGESRVELGAHGEIVRRALPRSSDLAFYDYATRGRNGTQAHYANNVYFPRSPDNPARCPAYINPDSLQCRTESPGISMRSTGNWRSGGINPDQATAMRFHEDGDIHAGDAASGNPPILEGGSGLGAPFPGSKGYRDFEHLGYHYANLASWFSQETVGIVEWTGGPGVDEHNKNRRGIVTFGDVTDPSTIPTQGTLSYSGIAYAWHSPDGSVDPTLYTGTVSVTVNLATREAAISLLDVGTGVLTGTIRAQQAAGSAWANLLTGTSAAGNPLGGGISARYFGPVTGGAGGTGPAEIGGAFSMTATTGQAVIGGFIAQKR